MTIKKPIKAASTAAQTAAPAQGGATIADRFKLDAPEAPKGTPVGGFAKAAFVAGLVALAVSGFLAYLLYDHWKYLMPV